MPLRRLCARLALLAALAAPAAGCGSDEKPLPKAQGGKSVDTDGMPRPKKDASAAE
ncbi:MAG: hypothetical protein K2X82_13415 [Gemmataceae bacterium]|nr:hypothetical protein [Gemmataceae bacterium]